MLLLERFISCYSALQTYKLLKGLGHTTPSDNFDDKVIYNMILSGGSYSTVLENVKEWYSSTYTHGEWG